MTEREDELREEQARLDETFAAYDEALGRLTARTRRGGVDEFADEALERMRRERIRVYTDASGPLYFGRIDPVDGAPRYIGRHVVVDRRNQVLVSNWRAPAAEPFYAATARDPRGISLRRRLDIDDRRVLGFVDETLDGDAADHLTEAIVEDITRRRVGEMRQIIATITPEQYAMIREDPTPPLVIQGGPGTGKTAVGLHRAAWLLYANPGLAREGVLIVGPNRTFIRYIGQVLPSLGEQSVDQREIDALISRPHREIGESRELATLKGSGRMAVLLHRLLWSRLRAPEEDVVIRAGGGWARIRADEVVALQAAARERTRTYQSARMRFRDTLADQLATSAGPQSVRGTAVSYADTVTAVRKTSEYQRLANRVWPRVTPERLFADLFTNRRRLKTLGAGLLADEEIDLLLGVSAPSGRLEMTPTDVALFDEARWLIDPDMRTFGHVVIDEAQNLTPMELRMVVRRARRQSLTILGDIAQRTTEAGLSTWANVLREAGVERFETRELELSYRVPDDFLRLASGVADAGTWVPRGVRRAPWPPVAVRADEAALGAVVALLGERMAADVGSVAVVAPPEALAAVRAGLEGLPYADAATEALGTGINLVDMHVVKGLEFDTVVVVEPGAILALRPDGGRGGLYTALTRSTRALAIVHAAELPAELESNPALVRLTSGDPAVEWAALRREDAALAA
ncbi:MAG TPA: AAA family ATPase [Solirubrobacteraceae bacterium]|nr:AAA family ATPase [Solirubrobacteraceae bacterium]